MLQLNVCRPISANFCVLSQFVCGNFTIIFRFLITRIVHFFICGQHEQFVFWCSVMITQNLRLAFFSHKNCHYLLFRFCFFGIYGLSQFAFYHISHITFTYFHLFLTILALSKSCRWIWVLTRKSWEVGVFLTQEQGNFPIFYFSSFRKNQRNPVVGNGRSAGLQWLAC